MGCVIVPLTFRDACYVSANIRQEDWAECRCQIYEEDKLGLAITCFNGTEEGLRWCAKLNGQPVSCVGLAQTGPTIYQVWMWSTKDVKKCFPTLLRHLDGNVRRLLLELNARRVEIRAMESHEFVTKGWMNRIGAEDCGLIPQYGKNGEDFRLYAWWRGMKNESDVLSLYDAA